MRKLVVFCFVLFFYSKVQAQENYLYHIEYDMQLNFDGYKKFMGNLYFNANTAYFDYHINNESDQDVLVNEDDDQAITFVVTDSSQYFIKSDKQKEKVLQLEKGFGEEKFYIVQEDLPKINWALTTSQKKIGSYNCYLAEGEFAGRSYNAWFTTDLSGFFGPWKYHGLPGVILQISDDLSEVQFFATKITTVDVPVSQIENNKEYKVVSRQEYIETLNQYVDDLSKKINTKIGRGFKVKTTPPKLKSIEIYEN